MPCAGRCDDPVPVLKGSEVLAGMSADSLERRKSPLPPTAPEGVEECVFAHIRERSGKGLGRVPGPQGDTRPWRRRWDGWTPRRS